MRYIFLGEQVDTLDNKNMILFKFEILFIYASLIAMS